MPGSLATAWSSFGRSKHEDRDYTNVICFKNSNMGDMTQWNVFFEQLARERDREQKKLRLLQLRHRIQYGNANRAFRFQPSSAPGSWHEHDCALEAEEHSKLMDDTLDTFDHIQLVKCRGRPRKKAAWLSR